LPSDFNVEVEGFDVDVEGVDVEVVKYFTK
jgi:hypothetical protein